MCTRQLSFSSRCKVALATLSVLQAMPEKNDASNWFSPSST